jgi:hypothetical protein
LLLPRPQAAATAVDLCNLLVLALVLLVLLML